MLSKIKKIRLGKWDKIWSAITRKAYPFCEYCRVNGIFTPLNAHHFKGRSCKATRFMLENAVILCTKHHVFSSEFSAHKTPEKFERWFKKEFPERYKAIRKKAQTMMSEREAIKEFEELIKQNGHQATNK